MMKLPVAAGLLAVGTLLVSGADPPEPRWITLNRAARQAVEAKDYSKLRDTLTELRPLLPGNPRILYNLAAAEARLGDTGRALSNLRDLANSGLVYDFSADDDFSALRGSPE